MSDKPKYIVYYSDGHVDRWVHAIEYKNEYTWPSDHAIPLYNLLHKLGVI